MKREVSVLLIAVLIVVAAILSVYYLNLRPTGFAVFEQNDNATFFGVGNYTSYENVTWNGSAIVLNSSENITSGSYTSKIFDSNNTNTTWNNLTWSGADVFFQVRTCFDLNCSTSNFTNVSDLNNLNLTGQYFQYRAIFDSVNDSLINVSVGYSVPASLPVQQNIQIDLLQPAGTKTSSPISIEFTVTGANLTCWYNVKNKDNGSIIIGNTTLSGCNNSTFVVNEDRRYLVSIYANNSTGFIVMDSSEFVYEGARNEEEINQENQTEMNVTNQTEIPQENPIEEIPTIIQISLGAVPNQDIIQGNSRPLTLSVQNIGNVPLSSCTLSGDNSGWITISDGAKNLGAGEGTSFAFSVAVPKETPVGAYTLSLHVACAETSGSTSFTVNVLQKKLNFNITNVQRTRLNKVSVDYTITELAGENQDLQIHFSIKDSSGVEVANTSQNKSVKANKTSDFRTNIPINESLNGTMTLSATFNSQIYSSSVLQPIDLSKITGGAIFGDIGAGNLVIVVAVVIILGAVFFIVRRMRKTKKIAS